MLLIRHDKETEEIKITPTDRTVTTTFEIDLKDGSVAQYPMDQYRSHLHLRVLASTAPLGNETSLLPAKVTVWEGALGFHLQAIEDSDPAPGELWLRLDISRSGAFALFAFSAYGAMVVLGLSAIVIALLTLVNVRRPEATLIGALAAIAFTLPVLRNALPGQPPLGVRADIFVFLWTELAAVIALGLIVLSWARASPRP
ncbi:MAG: DUF4436 family protein [Stellaceae bacterium]